MTTVLAITVACGAFLWLCVASPYEGAFGLDRCDLDGFNVTSAWGHDSGDNGECPCVGD